MGHLFGPNVSEVLEKRMKLSEAMQQLTQTQQAPSFRLPPAPAQLCYLILEQQLRHHMASQLQTPPRHRRTKMAHGHQPFHSQPQGGPCKCPLAGTKGREHKPS